MLSTDTASERITRTWRHVKNVWDKIKNGVRRNLDAVLLVFLALNAAYLFGLICQ